MTDRKRVLVRGSLVSLFVVVCLVLGGVFYAQMGGRIPLVADYGEYRTSFLTSDIDNMLDDSDVRIAGIEVGRVIGRAPENGKVRVDLALQSRYAPLHEGATVRVGLKSLVGATDVRIVDGQGPEIPSGTPLPESALLPSVQVNEVISGLRPATRAALSSTVQSLGAGTEGQARGVDELLTGLGKIANGGVEPVAALAAQSDDLRALGGEATRLVNALDTGRGQLAQVVADADRLTRATAGQRPALENTVRKLPGVLDSARTATGSLKELSAALAPVASDLNKAAPDLNQALLKLPGVTQDLRAVLKPLDVVLDRAPATLDRVPPVAEDVQDLVPELRTVLRDLNPTLGYLAPYGNNLTAMISSFGASFERKSENGLNVARLAPIVNQEAVRGIPFPLPQLPVPNIFSNPYPLPDRADQPAPFTGTYPRVQRADK